MENKKYTCEKCCKNYKTYKSMWHHKNKYHTQNNHFNPHNTNILPTRYLPNTHNNVENETSKPYKKTDQTICEYCDKNYSCYNYI